MTYRDEKDTMGMMQVPINVLWGLKHNAPCKTLKFQMSVCLLRYFMRLL